MIRDFQMIGRIGKIDTIQTQKGGQGCEVRIACSDYKDGEETTDWFSVVCFGKTADNVIDFYKVGDLVFFSGAIKMDTWKDKSTGKDRSRVKLLGFRSRRISKGEASRNAQEADNQGGGGYQQQPNQQQPDQQQGYNQQPNQGGYGNQGYTPPGSGGGYR